MLTTYQPLGFKKKSRKGFCNSKSCEEYADFDIFEILIYNFWNSFKTGVTSDWLGDLKESGAGIQHVEWIAVLLCWGREKTSKVSRLAVEI